MAAKLGVAPNYFTDFAGAQGGSISTYTAYATDLDTNFVILKTTINNIIDELNALSGPNAVIGQDVLVINDASGPVGTQNEGVIGEHSYKVTINGGDSDFVDIAPGQVFVNGNRANLATIQTLTSSGTSGTRYINVDVNGVPAVSDTPNNSALDIASIEWTGSTGPFTGSVTQLAYVFTDGDEMLDARSRPDDSGLWAAAGTAVARANFKAFRLVGDRIRAIERMITGRNTEADTTSLPPIGIAPGTAAAPTLVSTDGAGTQEATGWFRAAANIWGWATGGTEKLRIGSFGIRTQSGSVGTPVVAFTSDTDTGIRWASGLIGLVADGADSVQISSAAARGLAGSQIAPFWSFISDSNTGLYNPGADRLAISSGNATTFESTAEGHLDFPLQPRVRVENATESLASSALALGSIVFAASDESYDVGDWHEDASADFTVPTGGDGTYKVTLAVTFDETGIGAHTGQRVVAIQMDGNDKALSQVDASRGVGGPLLYTGGREGGLAASHVMLLSGIADPSSDAVNLGYRAHRVGSVTGVSFQFEVTAETTPGTIDIEVLLNDGTTLTAQVTTTGTGTYGMQATASPGAHAVAVGDRIDMSAVFGTFVGTIDHEAACVEILTTGDGDETKLVTEVEMDLVAADIIRARAAQNSGGTMNITDIEFAIRKVA